MAALSFLPVPEERFTRKEKRIYRFLSTIDLDDYYMDVKTGYKGELYVFFSVSEKTNRKSITFIMKKDKLHEIACFIPLENHMSSYEALTFNNHFTEPARLFFQHVFEQFKQHPKFRLRLLFI